MQLSAPHLPDDLLQWATAQLEQQHFVPGEVVLYNYVEWLKQQEVLAGPGPEAVAAAEDAAHQAGGPRRADGQEEDLDSYGSDYSYDEDEDFDAEQYAHTEEAGNASRQQHCGGSQASSTASAQRLIQAVEGRIVSGEPVVERKSTFQAHVARVHSAEEAGAVVEALLRNNKVRAATHNISAYRVRLAGQPGAFVQDCDDDGETAAGGRLLHLLQAAGCEDVVVVVSRWFGGVLLGPSRFALINNTARLLLEREGYVQRSQKQQTAGLGKQRQKQGGAATTADNGRRQR